MIRPGKQSGYILLPVIVVITLVAAIALLMTTESALESNTAGSELDAQQVRYVAEAGLNHALWMAQQQGCGPYSNLTDEPLGNDKYSSTLTTDLGSTSAFTIDVDQDTWIRSDQPTENKATDLKLHTRNEIAGTERPLIRYDLSPLAANSSILSATAWFYITNAHAAGPIDIHLTSADWTETDATWDSMSANMDSKVLATIPSQSATGIWIPVNLTAQVQAWVNGQPNYGITLNSTVDGVHGQYNSRESANPPWLEVIVGTPPTSPATLKADGTLANGVQRDIKRNDVVLRQAPPGVYQFQPDGANGLDTYLDESNPGFNNGISDDLWIENASGGNNDHGLFKFALGRIPVGARIENATLQLFQSYAGTTGGELGIHRLRRDWEEGNDSFSNGPGATWNNATTSQAWSIGGGEFDAEVIASATIAPSATGYYSWDITRLVQSWVGNEISNDGMLIKAESSGSLLRFSSSDHATAIERPRLTITYSCACGEVCVAPQGSGNLLMVVVNPTTLVAEDQKAKDLFESWGFTVNVISESANQATFDAGFAANDVVFISETVNSNTLGTKLDSAPIGVVSQDGDYNPDLGLASGSALTVGSAINVSDNSHYITRPFALGDLDIYSSSMEQLMVSSSLNAGQQELADIAGQASLIALDTGAAMEGGGIAAGRRVMLPLGTRYRFNWDYLNANGRVMVQRALTWGVGEITLPRPKILLVVGDEITLASRDTGRRNLMESWGYEVSIIDDNAAQADFDSKAAAVDVVYVSGTVSGPSLLDKLTGSPTPIVNEINGKLDNFGFSSSTSGSVTASAFSVTNASHYISEPFAGNPVTFFTTGLAMPVPGGTLAPDLQAVGETAGSTPALVTLDAAATRWDGNPAPARRVHLPFTNAETSQLTVDGETLMKRAIEWAGGAGCVILKPLLLVVGNDSPLATRDSGRKILMESWCYAVTVIDDGESQASFDAAAAAADVVYVSGTTSGPSLQDKLTGSPTPIVNEINGKLDNFGFSSSTSSSVSASTFSATSASHYISEPFAGGPVTFFTTDLAMPVPGGTLAPDLQTVGETTGAIPVLVTLDSGAQRWDATPAPARRVHLPFTNAETSQLTADGETLMRRSLEWAASTAASCDADYTPDTKISEFSTGAYGSNNIQGLTYFPAGKSFNGVAAPAGGAWISVNYADGRFYMTDTAGNYLTDLAPPVGAPTGVAYVASGTWADHLAVIAQSVAEIQYYDLNGTLAGSFSTTALGSAGATGVSFIGTTSGGVYDDHLAISDANLDMVLLVTQAGTLVSSFDTSSFSLRTNDLAHMPGSDKLLLLDRDAIAFSVDFSGAVLGQYDVAPFGSTVPEGIAINPVTCDHVVGDDTPDLVVTLNQAGGGLEGTFLDEFNAIAYNGDDGTLSWSNDWQETGESDGPGGGDFRVLNNSWCASGNCLQIREDRASTRRLSREADMSGAVSAILSLNYRRRHVSAPTGGSITLEISSNGGTSFTPLKVYDMGTQDAVQQSDSFDISAYIAPDTQLRFSTSNVLFETALYVDNVLIDTTGGGGGGPGYTELYQPWSASVDNNWETVDLSAYGVPANAVVEVAITNARTGAERWGGVRAVGSSLDRQFRLHEAEGGGRDTVTMHVQADANGQIQHNAERKTEVTFAVLGYWTGASYVELYQAFTADNSNTWVAENLGDDGLGPNQVAEIVMVNTNQSAELLAGVRASGAGFQRRFSLHEAEAGGVDAVTMMVSTDAASSAEVFATDASDIDFYVVGFWNTPPGTYTETGGVHGQATVSGSWQTTNLSSFGIPANSIAQFVMSNERDAEENLMGLRATGSTIPDRRLDLQEAESGGGDLGTMHVEVDAGSQIQWFAEYGATEGFFYPVGWWVLTP